jgi:hypothetical protein
VAKDPRAPAADHPGMTPLSSSSRVLLVSDGRATAPSPAGVSIKRYRLARLRIDGRSADPASRYAHLKRIYD